jgi:PQQ-dependent dehydrogenase (s-GDH family)
MLQATVRISVLSVILFFLSQQKVFAGFPPPGNDDCGSAVGLTLGVTNTAGTVKSATASAGIPVGCATGTPDDDVWYSFTLASTTSVTITLSNVGASLSATGAMLQLFSGPCGSLVSNTCGNTEISASNLVAGTYYIRVYSFGNTGLNSGANFDITVSGPPSNDDCAGAVTLSSGVTNASGTVWNASTTTGVAVGCATGTPDDDVWYKFTATAGNYWTIALSGVGSNLNTSGAMIQVFSGACGSLTSIACGNTSMNVSGLTAGNTYYIRVYSFGAGSIGGTSSGSDFSITETAFNSPINDECANAILLPTSTTTYLSTATITGATASAGIPIGSCTGTPDDDVWFYFTAIKPNPTIALANVAANISGTGGGSRMQLFSGSCGSLTSLACGTTSITASGLTQGSSYYVRVYSANAVAVTAATFDISVTDPGTPLVTDSTTMLFNIDTVAKNLGFPWEITYGPDDSLWITEARGYRVLRMSASRTGAQKNVAPQQILTIPLGSSLVTFDRTVGTWPQGGMEGLAIHPEFMTNPAKRWVYLAYVYTGTCPASAAAPCIFRSKIVRCQFYFSTDAGNPSSLPKKDTLIILDTIISNLPGSNDHNSARMKIGPTVEGPDNTYKLYYTIGDMGAGQFNNTTRTNNAQNKDTCEGKILRLNTEPDLDGVPGSPIHDYDKYRQWIPNDNPFTHSSPAFSTLRTPIFSYGHRNAQGLAWGQVGGIWRLYSCEHGDRSDDEVNIIQSGKNYGWPKITGVADDNYNTFDNNGNGYTMNDILANQTVVDEKTFAAATPNFVPPIFDFFNWSGAQIETINTGNIFTWPTIAPSSVDFYNSSQIAGWQNSLLVTSLKYGMYRLKLNAAGDGIDSTQCLNATDTLPFLHSWRVRDIAISPNGGYIWAVIDSSGSTSGPTGGFSGGNVNTKDGGKVLRLTYKSLTTLPVHFISFTGKLTPQRTVQLDWVAVIDQHHKYFEVEKSIDGNTFTAIGRVYSGPYQLFDYAPLPGNNYYRVKAVDDDGHVQYTRTINIVLSNSILTFSVYPNPVHDELVANINGSRQGQLSVIVTDILGHIMYKNEVMANSTNTSIHINVKSWMPAVYVVKVINSNNELIGVQKIIKQ